MSIGYTFISNFYFVTTDNQRRYDVGERFDAFLKRVADNDSCKCIAPNNAKYLNMTQTSFGECLKWRFNATEGNLRSNIVNCKKGIMYKYVLRHENLEDVNADSFVFIEVGA